MNKIITMRTEVGISKADMYAFNETVKFVCDEKGITEEMFYSKSNAREISESRFIVFYACRVNNRLTLAQLAHLADSDSSNVSTGITRIGNISQSDSVLNQLMKISHSKFEKSRNDYYFLSEISSKCILEDLKESLNNLKSQINHVLNMIVK